MRGEGAVKVCEICGARFRSARTTCPLDGGELRALPDPLLGQVIAGRYLVLERIGAGGMGVVYRAKHEVVGGDVALKFLSPQLAYEPSNRARFLREARAANRINHEHIIDITDYGETDDGRVYLVMEYLVGVPLNEEIANGALPVPRALDIAIQCARALARAHELGVVHRDIKPDNIYLLDGHRHDFVKILDFGLAHMKGELRVTATGTVFGTPEYMAPEQARGRPIQPSADLYSLGCVLFEMLTSQLPFQGSAPDLIVKHLREPPRPPSHLRPGIAPELDQIVTRLLSKAPADRFGSALELADALEALLGRDDTGAPTPPPRARMDVGTARDTLPSVGAVVASWEARFETLVGLVPRAHPDGPPSWLSDAIGELGRAVRQLVALRDALSERVTVALSCEGDVRRTRLRIGNALDALAADEAELRRQRDEAATRVQEARGRRDQVASALIEAWRSLPRASEAGPSHDDLRAIAAAGALARIHLDASETIEEVEGCLVDLDARREDLEFQISQLKGRLAGLSAVSEVDLDALREQTRALDRQLQEQLDHVVALAAPLMQHFMTFPHLHDALRAPPGEH